ncbi:hypothetical protein KIPB_005678 [Kipferlia bialata]|uniref:Uncharacterized protein n=1 Tax=Kipferlia bialata TaxID=797122 RepID=A0A9K3CW07_9EUKA|nr:hypothetical protein KIPB_005678 [Kipferlia bialata]|eukprot:g5678.t1
MSFRGQDAIHSIRFNQEGGCFSVATQCGFKVYNADPFLLIEHRNLLSGAAFPPCTACEMLYRTSVLALICNDAAKGMDGSKVIIWDDLRRRVLTSLPFNEPVRAVRVRTDRLAVVLSRKTLVYSLSDFKLLDHKATAANEEGLVALSAGGRCVLALPGVNLGTVNVETYPPGTESSQSGCTHFLEAHAASIQSLALSEDGSLVASASAKGTLIRVFDTQTGAQLHSLRRGSKEAKIGSMAFSPDHNFLAVTSSRKTIHIFSLMQGGREGDGPRGSAFDSILSDTAVVKIDMKLSKGYDKVVRFGVVPNTLIVLAYIPGQAGFKYHAYSFNAETGAVIIRDKQDA